MVIKVAWYTVEVGLPNPQGFMKLKSVLNLTTAMYTLDNNKYKQTHASCHLGFHTCDPDPHYGGVADLLQAVGGVYSKVVSHLQMVTRW